MIQSILLLLFAAGHSTPLAEPAANSACALITTAELETIVGVKLTEEPYLYNFPGGGSSCTYQRGQVQLVVFSGAGHEKKYEEYVKSNFAKLVKSGAPDMTKHPVSGVGSAAYFMSPRMPSAILVVNKGIHTLAIAMVAHNGKPESLQPVLISIAKKASSRLGLL
jgi:hypothetical protein